MSKAGSQPDVHRPYCRVAFLRTAVVGQAQEPEEPGSPRLRIPTGSRAESIRVVRFKGPPARISSRWQSRQVSKPERAKPTSRRPACFRLGGKPVGLRGSIGRFVYSPTGSNSRKGYFPGGQSRRAFKMHDANVPTLICTPSWVSKGAFRGARGNAL